MNKSALYLSILFLGLGVLIFLSFYDFYAHKVSLERNGLQFERMTFDEVVNPSNEPYVAISTDQDSKKKTIYYFQGYDSDLEMNFLIHKVTDSLASNKDLFFDAVNGNIKYEKELTGINLHESVQMWTSPGGLVINHQNIEFEAQRLLQHNCRHGMFGFFDDSPFVFTLFILGIFLALVFSDILSTLISRIFRISFKQWLYLTGIFILIFIGMKFKTSEWYMNSYLGVGLKNSIWLLFSFLLYQKLIVPAVKNLAFPDQEMIKFTTLLLGSFLFLWLGIFLGFTIDGLRLSNVVPFTNHRLPNNFSTGLLISFALGNLMNNIRKNVIGLVRNRNLVSTFRVKALESSSELAALQSSINPHFLYNSLNSIASLATSDGQKTEQMAVSLSAFYKYVNNKEDKHLSTLSDEVEMLESYLEIEKIRFGKKLNVELNIDPLSHFVKIPRFTLQPLVENAIKYGYANGGIHVKVSTMMNEDELLIMVFDEGKAFDEKLVMGFGLRSISKKLKLLFPNKHSLEFVNHPEKHVLIGIKLNKNP